MSDGKKEYTLTHMVLAGVGGVTVGFIAGAAVGGSLMEAIDDDPVKTAEENLARVKRDAMMKASAKAT